MHNKVVSFFYVVSVIKERIACRILGSHSGGYKEYYLVGYNAM
jgi:hypothetical protein